jgi:threonine dehydrogenase-like Zn-dependent dehydrogenase
VIVVGYRNAQRLALAAQLGAELAILSSQQDPVQAVLNHTEGFGADVVIMCAAGAESSILAQCLAMVRKNGRVVVVGLCPARDTLLSLASKGSGAAHLCA